jgi:CheY-like chemotaxis protein
VESQYGNGTQFRITLPLAKVAARSVEEAERPARELPSSESCVSAEPQLPTRLLVVDDEDFVGDLLREILEGEHCEVQVAESGAEALSLFRATEFDGVFTDIGMPGMSGWELAREIRRLKPRIPIAVITGWGEAVGSNQQKAAGVDWVVAKPFTADRVAELVQEINHRLRSSTRMNDDKGDLFRLSA